MLARANEVVLLLLRLLLSSVEQRVSNEFLGLFVLAALFSTLYEANVYSRCGRERKVGSRCGRYK